MESSLGPSVDEDERITSSEGSQMTSDNCAEGAGRLARIFAEFQARAAGKLVTSSVYETLLPTMADHSAMTLRGKQTRTKRPKKNKRLVGKVHRAMKAIYG